MKVDTMRRIDAWTGVPLCFVLSVVHRFFHFFSAPKPFVSRRILFVELSEMGSAILVDPAMKKARRESGAALFFVIFKKNQPSLKLLNTVDDDHIFTIREDSFFHLALDTLRFLRWTRRQRIDTVIDLELFARITALLSILSGARKRVGFHAFYNEGLYRGSFLTHPVAYNPHVHIAKNFIALVNAALSPVKEVPFSKRSVADEEIQLDRVEFSPAEKERMVEKIRGDYPSFDPLVHKLLLINPNASEMLIQRRWMPEYYVELMGMVIHQFPEVLVLITGSPEERAEAEALRRQVDDSRCRNLAGQLDFLDLPLLYSIAHCMVTNDSGPGHFSAVTNLPTFVIFGPETPKLYGSLGNSRPIYAHLACSPCVSAANHRRTPCTDNVCLQVIKPEMVFDQIEPCLRADTIITL